MEDPGCVCGLKTAFQPSIPVPGIPVLPTTFPSELLVQSILNFTGEALIELQNTPPLAMQNHLVEKPHLLVIFKKQNGPI